MLPAILVFGGLAVLVQQLGVFQKTASIFGAVLAAFCLTICLNELLFLAKAFRKKVIFFVRWCDILSVPTSIIVVTVI